MKTTDLLKYIEEGRLDSRLIDVYGEENLCEQRARYESAVSEFKSIYGQREVSLFSVPGRSEISGNHTDHNHGEVLAGSINLDIILFFSLAVIRVNDTGSS